MDFAKRGSRADEFPEIVQRLWAGETVTFEGKRGSSHSSGSSVVWCCTAGAQADGYDINLTA